MSSEQICKRNLEQPISENINNSWCERVARAVEGLNHNHAVGVGEVPIINNPKAVHGEGDHGRIIGKQPNDGLRKYDEHQTHHAKKYDIIKTGEPYRSFGAIRF